MIGLVLHPGVLIVIMWLVARHNAELNFLTAFLVIFGVSVCSALLGTLHPIAGLVGFIVLLPLALIRFCYLGLKQAFVVTGLFAGWLLAYELLWEMLLQ